MIHSAYSEMAWEKNGEREMIDDRCGRIISTDEFWVKVQEFEGQPILHF